MAWRYFYSTEESDTALKAILAGQDYISGTALVKGVYEYKILLENDRDYAVLANKIALGGIRAMASPERISQFGNILSDNYFDTSQYASGCAYRKTNTLSRMVSKYLSRLPAATIVAQRDLDIQGSASLGTVDLILSSLYKKNYNIPVNGSVSDRTLVKAIIDSTTPAVTQTNATCNQAMFDFSYPPDSVYANAIWADRTAVQGTWTQNALANQSDFDEELLPSAGYILNTTVALSDEISFTTLTMMPKTYSIAVTYIQNTDKPILSFYIGDQLVKVLDTYGGLGYNVVSTTQFTVPTLTTAKLRMKVTGKNALSTGYGASVSKIVITPV